MTRSLATFLTTALLASTALAQQTVNMGPDGTMDIQQPGQTVHIGANGAVDVDQGSQHVTTAGHATSHVTTASHASTHSHTGHAHTGPIGAPGKTHSSHSHSSHAATHHTSAVDTGNRIDVQQPGQTVHIGNGAVNVEQR